MMVQRTKVTPLQELPLSTQERIAIEVAGDRPPEKWRAYGGQGYRPLALLPSRGWYEWYWQRGRDPDRMRTPLLPSLRARVIERDGLACALCALPVDPADLHIDHIYPVTLGGSDDPDNLQVTHALCNMRKGARI